MNNQQEILIVGAGSVGKRHLKNLKTLGWESITVLRRKPNPQFEELYGVRVITDYSELEKAPFAVIACNPTSLHLEPLRFAKKTGSNLFMEKPLIHTEKGLAEANDLMQDFPATFFIGYMLRYHPAVKAIRTILEATAEGRPINLSLIQQNSSGTLPHKLDVLEEDPDGSKTVLPVEQKVSEHQHLPDTLMLGKPFSARLEFGSYLPGWPYQDYKDSYAARIDLGGGVINTISHELDLICHFFGIPEKVTAHAFNFGKLNIEAEELCEALFSYPEMAVSLHLDYLQKEYDRRIRILFDEGQIEWSWAKESIRIKPTNGEERILYLPMGDVNNLYLNEMNHFLELCRSHQHQHPLDAGYALANTRLLLEMHHSAKIGKTISIV